MKNSKISLITLSTLLADSADEKYIIFFFIKKRFEISCKGENLHEMSNSFFQEKKKKRKIFQNVVCYYFTQHAKR